MGKQGVKYIDPHTLAAHMLLNQSKLQDEGSVCFAGSE